MYGKSLQRNWNQSFTGSSQIIENPELLQAMEEMNGKPKDDEKVKETLQSSPILPVPTTPEVQEEPSKTTLISANKQIEMRLPSGKRRITPMFLTPAPVVTSYVFYFQNFKFYAFILLVRKLL